MSYSAMKIIHLQHKEVLSFHFDHKNVWKNPFILFVAFMSLIAAAVDQVLWLLLRQTCAKLIIIVKRIITVTGASSQVWNNAKSVGPFCLKLFNSKFPVLTKLLNALNYQ